MKCRNMIKNHIFLINFFFLICCSLCCEIFLTIKYNKRTQFLFDTTSYTIIFITLNITINLQSSFD